MMSRKKLYTSYGIFSPDQFETPRMNFSSYSGDCTERLYLPDYAHLTTESPRYPDYPHQRDRKR
jgi:hypothetical protein